MRLFIRVAAALAVSCSAAASSAAAGLVLEFRHDRSIDLVSATSIERVAEPRSFAGAAWSATAFAGDDTMLWRRAFPEPRGFDGADHSGWEFSLPIPQVAAGDRIVLRDSHGALLWQQIVDPSFLADAERQGTAVAVRTAAARRSTAGLESAQPRPSLLNQLRAQRATVMETFPAGGTYLAPKRSAEAAGGPLFRVSGSVPGIGPIRVRAFDAATGRFVVSTEQLWYAQQFEVLLPAGTYVFEFDENLENIDSDFFYRAPTRTQPVHVTGNLSLPSVLRDEASGQLSLLASVPCARLATPELMLFFDIWAADGSHFERRAFRDTSQDAFPPSGMCDVPYRIGLSPGTYTAAAAPVGWEPRDFGPVGIVADQTTEIAARFDEADRTMVWRGTVVDAEQRPRGDTLLDMHDQTLFYAYAPGPDASGHFEIPYRTGWIADFWPNPWTSGDDTVRRIQALDGKTPPSTIVIPDIALQSTRENGLLRLYGNGDHEHRFNILFLAEGFTDSVEAYDDVNGNGSWDGIVWYDLDGDGAYSAGDLTGAYGSPQAYPQVGVDPTLVNEPFDDRNGDGVPNLDDRGLFLRSANAFLRALFGSDFWDAHREAFNAYALFEPSEQAGYDVVSPSGEPEMQRSTLYGATLDLSRSIVEADRRSTTDRALSALPEVDLVVVLVNETVFTASRANVSLAQPGVMVAPTGMFRAVVNDNMPAHETAHFIAGLCDEYEEIIAVDPASGSTESQCPNVSHSTIPADIPWALPPDVSIPTRSLDAAPGVYEGGDLYAGGAYRPTFRSIMRDLSDDLFNAPSRAALERAVCRRTGACGSGHSTHARRTPDRAVR